MRSLTRTLSPSLIQFQIWPHFLHLLGTHCSRYCHRCGECGGYREFGHFVGARHRSLNSSRKILHFDTDLALHLNAGTFHCPYHRSILARPSLTAAFLSNLSECHRRPSPARTFSLEYAAASRSCCWTL